jgi:hypothetical protein
VFDTHYTTWLLHMRVVSSSNPCHQRRVVFVVVLFSSQQSCFRVVGSGLSSLQSVPGSHLPVSRFHPILDSIVPIVESSLVVLYIDVRVRGYPQPPTHTHKMCHSSASTRSTQRRRVCVSVCTHRFIGQRTGSFGIRRTRETGSG